MNAIMNGVEYGWNEYPSIASKAKRENAEIHWGSESTSL